MPSRQHNFSAGPAALPLSVIEEVKSELPTYADAGASVMEISHRSPQYTAIAASAVSLLRELLGLTDEWHVLFLQGGASMQFYQVPLNFLGDGSTADYVNTGAWSAKAIAQARAVGKTAVVASSEESGFDHIPAVGDWSRSDNVAYTHITTNNTIYGTRFSGDPDVAAPIVADMSSDFLSRPINLDRYGLIYAGAQKNLGPAGVTIVLLRDYLLQRRREGVPTMLDYGTHAAKLFNTPPVFAVYIVEKVLRWIKAGGGLAAMAERNEEKAGLLYDRIDASGFYRGVARLEDRSRMNVTFRLPSEDLEKEFVAGAAERGLRSLKGHRSAGGVRASIYNACPQESVEALVSFMSEFEGQNG